MGQRITAILAASTDQRKDCLMAYPQAAARIKSGPHLAQDARADHGTRLITLRHDMIQIERVLSGMKMRVHVPAQIYIGVALIACDGPDGTAYEIKLSHRDPELSILLETSADRQEAENLRLEWAAFFGRPVLDSNLTFAGADAQKQPAFIPRRRCMTLVAKRRPRRALSRKPGNRENLLIVRRDEREIICYE